MNYFAECLAKFQALPENIREAFGGLDAYAATREIEAKYNVKLSFLVILIAISELEETDIEEYLILKFKITSGTAKKVRADLVAQVLDPAFEKTFNIPGVNTLVATKEDLINLFTSRIIESLNAGKEIISGLNIVIFKLLNEEEDLEEKIITILYNNNEFLTSARLTLDNREIPGTISNWLKDFIKTNGSEIFDDLVLAQYLSTSTNTKKLNSEDKNLVRKVLKLYRSLAFFPESMENLAISDWQIIPYDKSENNHQEMRDVLGDEETQTQAKMQTSVAPSRSLRPVKPVMSEKSKAPATPVNNETSTLFELQDALKSYTPESLEHKAVAQEIERLNKKKKTK